MCAGFAAWGENTVDESLIATGMTDDLEGNFSATVMVFPESGNNFVTQTVNVVGFGGFPNHPNMNNKGLVRVHCGGSTFTANEATSYSAVPRGIADMHTILFANNTWEAYEMFLAYFPGIENLGACIFYADVSAVHDDRSSETHHVLVAESRAPVSVRYPGDNGKGDFWYWWSVSRSNILFNLLSQKTRLKKIFGPQTK